MLKYLLSLLLLVVLADQTVAASISRHDRSGRATLIVLEGELESGDVEKFRSMLAGVSTATVLLSSNGGSLYAGMEIGRTVRMRGFSTMVSPGTGECASACAFAWVAGSPRMLERGAKLGFHAAYIMENGKPVMIGSGNALVGAYLRDLGLSDAAIFFATEARPESIRWLTEGDVVRLGMSVTYVEGEGDQKEKFPERLAGDSSSAASDSWAVPRGTIPVPELLPRRVTTTTVVHKDSKLERLFTRADPERSWQEGFLYEEQLGGPPIAIPAKVSWHIDGSTGGPFIEATVVVDERNFELKARLGLNRDASLPASHLWEFIVVRSGQLGSPVAQIQRIAFKQTEQDRGNSLIAVPAKVRSDFHLVALNNDSDALRTNTDLMLSRDWIDIPMVLDSNRRILLTFRKGVEAEELFRQTFAAWQN